MRHFQRFKHFQHPNNGFTLIELLVAATIFVAVMVIVTATLSQLVKMQKRILYRRQVNQAVRQGVERITRIIQEGTAEGNIGANSIYGVIGMKKCQVGGYTPIVSGQPADLIVAIAPDPETDGYLVRLLKITADGTNILEAEFADSDGNIIANQLDSALGAAIPLFLDNTQLTRQNGFDINCGTMGQTVFKLESNVSTKIGFWIAGEIENKDSQDTKLQFKTFATSRYRE